MFNTKVIGPDSISKTAGLAKSLVIAGSLKGYNLYVFNTNVAAQYIHIYDAASLPADATVSEIVYKLAADAALDIDLRGLPFFAGLVVCSSSTAATKTIGAANDILIKAGYRKTS